MIVYLSGVFTVMICTVILNELFLYKKYQIDTHIMIVMAALSWFSVLLLLVSLEKQMLRGN